MLQIFCAREDIDKEKFIYENIDGEALVIVPDQYTLVGEEQALKYLGTACLLDVEVLGMNRVGLRALTELGQENVPILDKYERYMLLSKVIREQRENLEIFKIPSNKTTFVEMINEFISDFKQQECTVDDLALLIDEESADPILQRKLEEIKLIAGAYEEALAGKFADNEDYISMYTEAISKTHQFENKTVWVYGYDSLTPKLIGAIIGLAKVSKGVNVMINVSDFGMEAVAVSKLTAAAASEHIPCQKTVLLTATHSDYAMEKSETIKRIERGLFARGRKSLDDNSAFVPEDLRVVECANTYNEAESAAAYVYELLRDHGYSMKDIVIIANDADVTQKIVKRVFDEYGLPVFVDSNKGIGDSPVIAFVVSILEAARYDYRTNAILTALKSGVAGVDINDVEELENYVKSYQIKGTMWTKPFKYGRHEYDDDTFALVNSVRGMVAHKIEKLRKIAKDAKTINEFAEGFYVYLQEEWNLKDNVEEIKEEQYNNLLIEEAQKTVQSYNEAIRILDRVRDILGDEEMDLPEFLALYTEGVMSAEVGIIPPTVDGMSMGTLIRTRPAPPKAVLILGANEGVLPMEPNPEGLFSVDEKAFFTAHDFPIGVLDDVKMQEENVAMYRIMSRASEKVYVSYSMSDGKGSDMKPSVLIDSIKSLFPKMTVSRDIVSQGYGMPLIASDEPALRHMINYFKEKPEEAALTEAVSESADDAEVISDAVMRWYEGNKPEVLERVIEAGRYENSAGKLTPVMAKRLFARGDGAFSFSASRLEQYNHCPFKHFINHGLRPLEQKEFTSSALEIGDVYHDVIMGVSRELVKDGILNYDPENDAPNAKFEPDNIAALVEKEIKRIAANYKDGLFDSGEQEKYRLERIQETCLEAVLVLATQMKLGQIKMSFFEEEFGRGCKFQPIVYSLHGHKVYIEGKIDRVDIMDGDTVRIIDYKTGKDKLDVEQMRCGYKMQLMVYMQGAEGKSYSPAGMFYFNIADDTVKIEGVNEEAQKAKLEKELDKRFKLNGAFVDTQEIRDRMPMNVLSSRSIALTEETFGELESDVHKVIETISDGIITGDIRIEPAKLRTSDKHAECRYCKYKAICRFDLSYKHNNYRMV